MLDRTGHSLDSFAYQPMVSALTARGRGVSAQNAKRLSQTIKHGIQPGSQWGFLMAVCPRRVSGSRKGGFRA